MLLSGIFHRTLIIISFLATIINAENTANQAENTLQFVNNVLSQLKLTSEPNITLVIGNTGSGKSTLVHYVAGDYSKMISIEPTGDKIDYAIYDGLDPDIDRVSSTTVSRTLVPEMLIDESNFVWYDCPGFGDTRNTTVEIATTFLIKSVIENALNIKIVLVVNRGSTMEGYDRSDLDTLLTHTTHLVQNIDRYVDSVSIVVTKVEPYKTVRRKSIDVTEEQVKRSVANFLSVYRSELVKKEPSSAKIHLVDALSKQSPDGEFIRIGVFWRPGDPGPFNTIEKTVKGRKLIRDIILQHTIYTEIRENDFGHSLSDGALRTIDAMTEYAINDIHRVSFDIDRKLLKLLQEKTNRIHDFHERMELLEYIDHSIESIKRAPDNITISDMSERINSLTNELNSSVNSDELRHMARLDRNLKLFKSFSRIKFNEPTGDYVSETFSSVGDYIKRELVWSTFLVTVYKFFAQYEVQRDVTLYNVKDIEDWKKAEKEQGLHITENNLQKFAKQFYSNEHFEITEQTLEELNAIIEFTLNSAPSIECNDDTMTIRGNFLKSSDIQKAECQSAVSKIRAFVVSTFFVDSDLHLDKELEIFADKWIILNNYTFYLNGKDGQPMAIPQLPGTPGEPGQSGSNGKNFFGFAKEIIDGEWLSVKTSGGNGGAGQDGTSNRDQSVKVPNSHSTDNIWIQDFTTFYERYLTDENQIATYIPFTTQSSLDHWILIEAGYQEYKRYEVSPRRCCGKNGLGGAGGIGGLAGQYLFVIKNGNFPQSMTSNGMIGNRGKDAAPCNTTAAIVRATTELNYLYIAFIMRMDTSFATNYTAARNCPNLFVASTHKPLLAVPIEPLQPTMSVIEYKTFLRKQMMVLPIPFLRSIRMTYDAIDSDTETNKMMTVKDLVMDATALEKQFPELNEKTDVLPMYTHLLMQIENYADELSLKNSTMLEGRVMSLLYAYTLSKIISLKSDRNSDLVIDIEKYFDVVLSNIQHVEQLGRIIVINENRDNYKATIEAKIFEGIDFIQNGIQRDIENLFFNLDTEIQQAVDEIRTVQVSTIAEIKAKDTKIQNLQRNMYTRIFANILNVVHMFVGNFASAGTSILGFLAEKFVDGEGTAVVAPLAKIDQNVFELIKNNDREKLDAIQTELNLLHDSPELSGTPHEQAIGTKLNGLTLVRLALSKALEMVSNDDAASVHDKVESFISEVKEFVAEQVKGLSDEFGPTIESFRNASMALNVIESLPSLYNQYSMNSKSIDTISAAINADQRLLHKLYKLEAEIYSDLLPSFSGLQQYLGDTTEKLSGKSAIALRIQQVKIQQKMRKIQKRISDTMSGVELASNAVVRDCILKIHETVNLIINIYDRIQGYEEQSCLIVHLTELHSVSFRDAYIGDAQLKDTLNELQFNLQSNILLTQYDRAVDGFKQAIFPFAADYLDIYRLEPVAAVENDTNAIIGAAIDKLKSLSERIKELNTTVINRNDAVIHNACFNSETGPFYTWQNNEIREQIRRLFAGEKVYLLADVRRSTQLNAVKFNSIGIQFRAANATSTTQLEDILLPFHVTMTHMGDSHYRCGNQFYTINSPSQEIAFSFRRQSHTHSPMIRNAVYDKLSSSIALLSPYALWSVQLSNGQFDKLNPFVDFVDIELHGYGKYVGENAIVCNTDLSQYYYPFY